jgi:membrane-bound lytic murein transglycosylase D
MTPPHRPLSDTPVSKLALIAAAVCFWLAGCASQTGAVANGDAAPVVAQAASAPELPASAPAPEAAASAVAEDDDASKAAAAPIDPLRPDVRVDLADRSAQQDLWARVRAGFALPDLDNDLVHAQEQWYAARPDYVQRMTDRGSKFLFHVVEEVEKRGMPTELALLPFIESAFNPQATSVAKAAGMWQFVPGTANDFDLKQNIFRDDRRNVLASTKAALDYLVRLNNEFHDWRLTLAAYNWGVGNVRKAIARNERAGLPTDYESLRMPDETRNYVPKLQAVKNIVTHPENYGLTLPPLENHPYFLSVPIERDIDVDLAAKLAEVDTDEFKFLNPQMNKPVILAAGTPQLLLPYDNANAFVRNLGTYHGPLATWTAWVAPKTLRPADAAKQLGISEATLRDVNHIPARMLVKAGSTLLVPRSARRAEDVPERVADNATIALAPDLPATRKVNVRVGKRGETVASVARRYHVSAEQVAQWNKVSADGRFKGGQMVALYTTGASRTVAHNGKRASATKVAASGTRGTTRRRATKVASHTTKVALQQ